MPRDRGFLLGEKLVQKGIIDSAKLKDAMEKQKITGNLLGEVLTELGYTTEEQIVQVLSEQLGIPYIDVTQQKVNKDIVQLIPETMAREHVLFPLFRMEDSITVAMKDPLNIRVIDRLKHITNCDIDPVISTNSGILKMIDNYYGVQGSLDEVVREIKLQELSKKKGAKGPLVASTAVAPLSKTRGDVSEKVAEAVASAAQAPVIKLVNTIFKQAVKNGASDIHLEPEEEKLYLRYRIDGVLYDAPAPPENLKAAIISRIKIMATMDIAEKRLPQDGNIQLEMENKRIDMRVSTFPTIYGENLSIRVLNRETMLYSTEELGLEKGQHEVLNNVIDRPNGIVLVTGPTGCGKTTTLYAILNKINTEDKNIITLEDPVEYRLPRVRQSQIDIKAGLTFANGLRSILRQDPDIIFIGEIRDLETAEIAIRAALTGHLVLSTLHTNDAPSAMTRLIDMGVEPFLVSSSVVGVIAQRLVRKICPKCKQAYKPNEPILKTLNLPFQKGAKFYKTKGCDDCRSTGYKGRTGIFELLEVSENIKEMVLKKLPASELKKEAATNEGMMTLRQVGAKKVVSGITTVEEILRVAERDIY